MNICSTIQAKSRYYFLDLVLQQIAWELREEKEDTNDRLQFSENVQF
jgi:hypothetical protein